MARNALFWRILGTILASQITIARIPPQTKLRTYTVTEECGIIQTQGYYKYQGIMWIGKIKTERKQENNLNQLNQLITPSLSKMPRIIDTRMAT